jgi:AcrR family transcriptional regulator
MVHIDPARLLELEREGLITATYRRLDPDRQAAITAAILAEARERGPARVRLKETAAAAGVSVGSLYQYFGDRDGVLGFAIELVCSSLVAELNSYLPLLARMPLRDGLTAWVSGGEQWTQEYAAAMRFFARGAYEGDPVVSRRLVAPVSTVMVEAIRTMLAAGIERGEVRPELDLDATARAVHVQLSGVMDAPLIPGLAEYFRVAEGDVTAADTLAAAIELVIAGVQP